LHSKNGCAKIFVGAQDYVGNPSPGPSPTGEGSFSPSFGGGRGEVFYRINFLMFIILRSIAGLRLIPRIDADFQFHPAIALPAQFRIVAGNRQSFAIAKPTDAVLLHAPADQIIRHGAGA
jgi:hypothetical protein